jgi:metal-responsive CopG/Arc/MetJ family transcriptional regulator
MTNVTVPLSEGLLEFVDRQVDEHKADSRAGFIRRLIASQLENEIFEAHVEAVEVYRQGKTLKGNLRDYRKK